MVSRSAERAWEEPWEARLDELAYAVVDVETTGSGGPEGERVMEVAVVEVRDGRPGEPYVSLVDPGVPIRPWVRRLTGLTDGDLRGAPRFEAIAEELLGRLEGRVFAAHNAAFDRARLTDELRRVGARPLPAGPRLCTLRLARRALPGLERRGLDALAEHYGIPVHPRHRAAGDAAATARVLARLLAEVRSLGVETWGELRAWLGSGRRGRRRGSLEGAC